MKLYIVRHGETDYNQKKILQGKPVSNFTNKKQYDNYFENCTLESVESIQDLMKRVEDFIQELKQNHSEKTVLLVTHAGWISAFMSSLKPIPEDGNLEWFELDNAKYLEYNI